MAPTGQPATETAGWGVGLMLSSGCSKQRSSASAGKQPEQLSQDSPEGKVAAEYRPELVLLDIGLPRLNGYEVARRLRRQPGLDETVLVALTGYGQEKDRRRSQAAGFDHHLIKPVDPDSLQALVAASTRAH